MKTAWGMMRYSNGNYSPVQARPVHYCVVVANPPANYPIISSRNNARFCHTAVYPGGTTDFLCASRRPRGLLTAQLSTPGQKARTLTKFVISPPSSSTTQQSSTRSHSSHTSDKPTSTSSTSVRDSGLAAKPENTSKSSSSSSSSYSSPSSSSSTVDTAPAASSSAVVSPTPAQESSNTGAIAGGVVGGLAGLGLVIFAVFFFLRRKKTQDTQPRAAPSLDGQKPLVTANSLRASAPSPSPSNPFSDPPQDSARQDASFSQLANAFPSVPEPLNLSKTSLLSPNKRAVTPTQLSPLSAVTIVAVKAMPDPEKALVVYPEPSPMSTPSGSPRSAYRTPDATSFYPNYPQYRPPSSRSQSGLQSGWPTSPITREGNASPVSTFPVSPVSPLGSNRPNKDIGVPDFPLVLQPGMGMQRLAPGTVKQVTLQRGASRRNQNPKAEGPSQSSTDGEEKPSTQQNAND